MLGAVWLCVLVLALPCWTYPSGHKTTCEEFSRGVSFDPVDAVGEWFTVYSVDGRRDNFTEKFTIRELTSSELQQYDQAFRNYSKDQLKFEMKVHQSHPTVADANSVLVLRDDAGNVDVWHYNMQVCGKYLTIRNHGPYLYKWKSVDGFLVMMGCKLQWTYVLSKSATPDEDKLERVVESLHIEGITGGRVYSS